MKTTDFVADIKVSSKTIEDIKKWLVCCAIAHTDECNADCENCEYDVGYKESIVMGGKTLAYIQQLESRLAQVERYAKEMAYNLDCSACTWCEYVDSDYASDACKECRTRNEGFKLRSVCPENTREDEK